MVLPQQSEIPDQNVPLAPTAGPTLEPHFPDAANTDVPNRASSDEETEEGCESLGHSPQSKEALAKAILRLGMRVLENLKTTPEQPNVIVSPLSISLALSQLALGRNSHDLLFTDTKHYSGEDSQTALPHACTT